MPSKLITSVSISGLLHLSAVSGLSDSEIDGLFEALSARDGQLNHVFWRFRVFSQDKAIGESPSQDAEKLCLDGALTRSGENRSLRLDDYRDDVSLFATWDGRQFVASHYELRSTTAERVERSLSDQGMFDNGAYPPSFGLCVLGRTLPELKESGYEVAVVGREEVNALDCIALTFCPPGSKHPTVRVLIDDRRTLLAWKTEVLRPATPDDVSSRVEDCFQVDGVYYVPEFRWRLTHAFERDGLWLPSEGFEDSPGLTEATEAYLRLEVNEGETTVGEQLSSELFEHPIEKGTLIQNRDTGRVELHESIRPERVSVDAVDALLDQIAVEEGLILSRQGLRRRELDVSCGVTAAYMFAVLHSFEVDPGALIDSLPVGIGHELSLHQLRVALSSAGDSVYAYSGDISALREAGQYVLAHLQSSGGADGHFVVAKGTEDGILIADGLDGKYFVSESDFNELTDGQVRFLSPRELRVGHTGTVKLILVGAGMALVVAYCFRSFVSRQ